MKPSFLILAVTLLPIAPQSQPTTSSRPADRGPMGPFFAMSTITGDADHASYESQAKMMRELGYAGWAPIGVQNVPEMLKALDAQGLKMFALYVGANLDPDQPPYDPKLKDVIHTLEGRDTILWLYVLSKKHKPSSPDGDERAVTIIREIADLAAKAHLRVALYPHVGFYVARVEDAVRLARKIERPNVGVTFNLCHWLSLDHGKNMETLLRLAMPHLLLVTINGADSEGTGWDRLIQVLGRGDFDVYGFLKKLRKLGYKGPIGLQGYGLKGDVHENLRASMNAWQAYSARLAAELAR